jgi:glycosyltransferase involved in cell wall biosynthesis
MQHPARSGRILIVANELKYLFRNGGVGTHNWLLAETLAAAGWSVGILYCGPRADPSALHQCAGVLERQGIQLWPIDSFSLGPLDNHPCPIVGPAAERSHRVLRAVESLSTTCPFDLIEFADWQGCGFRTVQARRLGASLPQTRIIVKLHSSSQWCREGNRVWVASADELIGDYCERYAFEHADVQLAPCRYMLDYARSIGWQARDDARVLEHAYPRPEFQPAACDHQEPPELVFFGRLETRKGLTVFLQAVSRLPPDTRIAFLGSERVVENISASQLIAESLPGRSYRIETGLEGHEALSYLAAGNRLAVIPSLVENSPFTVVECAANGIPFIASAVGGIPELLPDERSRERVLFEPTAAKLTQKLQEYLCLDPRHRQQMTARIQSHFAVEPNRAKVAEFYAGLLPDESARRLNLPHEVEGGSGQRAAEHPSAAMPLVSIAVPFYNLGDFLPETLESIAAQTYSRLEVFVIDDGSTEASSLDVWDEMRRRYPGFHFVRQENRGLSGARNTALAMAGGEYFLPVDADNIARPEMVERLVAAMERQAGLSALACYHGAFTHTEDIASQRFCYVFRPTGGPFVASCIRNIYGDANAIFRTAALRDVGGYEADQRTTCEDWEVFVKLAKAGHALDVYPEFLFYYRHREESMLRTTSAYLNQMRVVRQFYSANISSRTEQMALWSVLLGLEEQRCRLTQEERKLRGLVNHLTASLARSRNNEAKPLRAAVERFKRILKCAPYYSVLSAAVKQLTRKAA